jgi:hypothetical protein
MPLDRADLDARDKQGYTVLDALSHIRGPQRGSLATPHLFTCADGHGYWVKAASQHGLLTELIAARLAARVGAGPDGSIIRVPKEALPSDGSLAHFEGVIVGSRNRDGAVNQRDLDLLGVTSLDPAQIAPDQRARVVAFQTWVGEGDLQLLVDLRTGEVMSFDHGECFGNTSALTDPVLTVAPLPGIPDTHGNNAPFVAEAVDRVESVGDDELLDYVSRMPLGDLWKSDPDRRLQIAQWLLHRRGRVREAMKQW